MKSLIFLALVVQALAGPFGKPERPGPPRGPFGPKPSHPPPTGLVHPSDVTGHPPRDNSSRPPHPEGLEGAPRPRRQAPEVSGSAPPKTGNPLPANGPHPPAGGPPPSGKPPAQRAPQGKPEKGPGPRSKRHLNGARSHPTAVPRGDHTHNSNESRPSKPVHSANGKNPGKRRQ